MVIAKNGCDHFFRKGILSCLSFFLLTSCCFFPCSWEASSAVGLAPSYNSARLYLPPANEFSGLALDLVNMQDGLRTYIDVFGLAIPPDPDEPSNSRVFISFKDHAYNFSAVRFTGGQRLLIPEYVQSEMLDYLQEGQPVFIQVDRYQADIYPDKFLPLFNKMLATPL